MDAVESNMITTNTNIGNIKNSVNYTSHTLAKFTKEIKQSTNFPALISTDTYAYKLTQKNDSTTTGKDNILGDQFN